MSPGQGIYASSSRAVDRFGRLDALVSNAGVATVAPLADGSLADWDRMIDVNLRAVMHGIAAALPVFTVAGFWALRHHHLHRGHKIGLRTRGVRGQ
jgi:NADP-dependent 3-hydroxy acid dehydrogenase YdfG